MKNHNYEKKIMKLLLSVFVLFSAMGLWSVTSQAEERMTVRGESLVSGPTTKIRIRGGVVTRLETLGEALDANSIQMASIFNTLENLGIAEEDVQTSRFQFAPKYRNFNNGDWQEIIGYEVSNNIAILVRDVDQIGTIAKTVVDAGMNRFSGLDFLVEDSKKLTDEAERLAMTNAIEKAERLATAGNFKLGHIIEVNEGRSGRSRNEYAYGADMAAAATPGGNVPIASGEVSFQANVTIVFAIDNTNPGTATATATVTGN